MSTSTIYDIIVLLIVGIVALLTSIKKGIAADTILFGYAICVLMIGIYVAVRTLTN